MKKHLSFKFLFVLIKVITFEILRYEMSYNTSSYYLCKVSGASPKAERSNEIYLHVPFPSLSNSCDFSSQEI
jgi:hypothetical protein